MRIKEKTIRSYGSAICMVCLVVIMGTGWHRLLADDTGVGKANADRLAFVANVDGNWDVCTARQDGSELRRLTDTPYDEIDPAWSPDKSLIAYAATDGHLRILNIDSNTIMEFAPIEQKTRYVQPDFSPDGKYVTFVIHSTAVDDNADIAILDLADGHIDTVVAQRSIQLFPMWSPVSDHIYYVNVTCATECGRIIQDIWRVSLDTYLPEQITLTNAHCMQPAESPDGTEVVFSSNKGGSFNLWMYRSLSGELSRVTSGTSMDMSPCWLPGGKLAFTSTRKGMQGIYFLDVATGEISSFLPFNDKEIACKDPDS